MLATLSSCYCKTVANYVSNILGKLQVVDREEAIHRMHEAGWGRDRIEDDSHT